MCGSIVFASCSSDDEKRSLNTNGNVYISLSDAEITTKENKNIINVPFTITGERNGYVTATCQFEEYIGTDVEPAMEDVHYYLSGETVTVWEDENSGNFEIRLVDDNIINDPRMFVVKLATVEGAQISGITETYITIKDNDNDPYDRVSGTWKCYDSKNSPVGEITLNEFDEDQYGYKKYYDFIVPLYKSYSWGTEPELMMNYTSTGELTGYLTFKYGNQDTGQAELDGSYSSSVCINYELSFTNADGVIELEWSEDFTELYVTKTPTSTDDEENPAASIYVMCAIGNYAYIWAYIEDFCTLRR